MMRQRRLNAILSRVLPGGKVAEIGVYAGTFSRMLITAGYDLIMVDSWLPGDMQPAAYKETRDYHTTLSASSVSSTERMAKAMASRFKNVKIIHADSVAAAEQVADKSLDLAFIDADHSYEGCKRDIEAWAPKVRAGGYIGGHDYGNPDEVHDFSGVDRAVNEFAEKSGRRLETDVDSTWFVRL
jgi:hypothetical protein